MNDQARDLFRALFEKAGLTLGQRDDCDVVVHDPAVFSRWLTDGSLGLGETYMDGAWDAARLDDVFAKLQRLSSGDKRRLFRSWQTVALVAASRVANRQSERRARMVTEEHYDLGNDFFAAWLDARMIYSCAVWGDGDDLDAAQRRKLDLVATKLALAPGMRVLDLGCGWGGAARYLAETYDVHVTAVNIAREQLGRAREHCRDADVSVVECDYRALTERFGERAFDAVYSLGMIEHVGWKNYPRYMAETRGVLREGGRSLIQTIGATRSLTQVADPWIDRYIFPNGMLPSMAQLTRAAERLLVLEHVENLGPHYDRTLLAWNERFQAHVGRGGHGLSTRFVRMWTYYLLSCAGMFRARTSQLWQVVFARDPGRR